MKSIFVFPPIWSNKSPSTGVSAICGYLNNYGYQSEIIDLNIEFYNKYLCDEKYTKAKEYIISLCNKEKLSENEQEIIEIFNKNLKIYNAIENRINYSKEVVQSEKFYNESEYKVAKFVLQKAIELISLKNYPILIHDDRIDDVKKILKYQDYKKEALNSKNIFYEFISKKAEEIAAKQPNLVGISINFEGQMLSGLTLANILKTKYNIKISLGGTNISRLYNNIIDDYELFDLFADFIMIGSGEVPTYKLFLALQNEIDLSEVPSLIYKDNDKIVSNEMWDGNIKGEYCQNYDFSLDNKYFLPEKVYLINISRGCYWGKCKFCDFYLAHSNKDINNVIKEIKELQNRYGAKYFYFTDSALSPKNALQFAEAIIKEKLNIRYTCFLRFEECYDKKFLSLLYKSGLRCVSWGLESGNQRVLDLMNKGTKIKIIERILKDSAKLGIANRLTIIYLFPGETFEEFCQTIDFLKKHYKHIFYITFHRYILKRYSYVFEHKEEFGIRLTTSENKSEYERNELGLPFNQEDYNKKLGELTSINQNGGIYQTPDETLLYISHNENKNKSFLDLFCKFIKGKSND